VIRLQRTRTPAAIAAVYRPPGRDPHLLHLLDVQLKGVKLKEGLWGAVKEQLKEESAGKCGYCEGVANFGMYGDVEHIRPKSEYWWLAYCYDNYVYSCQLCNQKYKKTKFPIAGQRMPAPALPNPPDPPALAALAPTLSPDPLDQAAVDQFIADCLAERPGIPDPYAVDPEPLFSWLPDDNVGEVEIRPRDASHESQRAFDAVVGALGLNRQELKGIRYFHYQMLQLPFHTLRAQPSPAAKQIAENTLRLAMARTAPFAGMTRYFVREVEGLPL
jgi:5-methylcytosine-specific restriction endonuclease McrA